MARCRELQARSIINITKWLQADIKYLSEITDGMGNVEETSVLCSKLKTLLDVEKRQNRPKFKCSVDIGCSPGIQLVLGSNFVIYLTFALNKNCGAVRYSPIWSKCIEFEINEPSFLFENLVWTPF